MFNFPDLSHSPRLTQVFDGSTHAMDQDTDGWSRYMHDLGVIGQVHGARAATSLQDNIASNIEALTAAAGALLTPALLNQWLEYVIDAGQRAVLFADAMRERGNLFAGDGEGGNATVLSWDHTLIIDGTTLARPVNVSLLRITAPAGISVRENARPYIIIDPRAGPGVGSGGFNHKSESGAALHEGHPTYSITATRPPMPGQTLADVTAAQAGFEHEVRRRHPHAPRPVIIGNRQGGWATMLLAATNPDITGPLVAIGAPLSYWAGQKGQNPMRYLGGLLGGASTVHLLSDLGYDRFDGANLVFNAEGLSPATNGWERYYRLWDQIDTGVPDFVGFERWWGRSDDMGPEEIAWIVENLFIGNHFGRGQTSLDAHTQVDLRDINAPIICLASHGDAITPPRQALGWIADYYNDVEEIRARGQRILYSLREDLGHPGLVLPSAVDQGGQAVRESTLAAIEALAPGLYEMVITDEAGEGADQRHQVSFAERTIEEVMTQCGDDDSDVPFAAVARWSELATEVYDLTLRPLVRAISNEVNEVTAGVLADTHPMRLRRWLQSDRNPLMQPVAALADAVREERRAAADNNPFRVWERLGAALVTQGWNCAQDLQHALIETSFHLIWAAPPVAAIGEPRSDLPSDAPREDLRTLTSVQDALEHLDEGGFADGVIRMLIFLAHSRKAVRRSRIDRSNERLMTTEPFASMKPKARTRLVHKESLIVGYEPEEALAALPRLIPDAHERRLALSLCAQVVGPREAMSPETVDVLNRLALALEQPPLTLSDAPLRHALRAIA